MFWSAFGVPTFVAFLVALPLWIGVFGPNTVCFRLECYETFASAFKLPVTIWALAVPLCALAVSAHRSNQTARQIELQTRQNTFSNYFIRLMNFEEHAYSECATDTSRRERFDALVDVRGLHRLMYPDAQHSAPEFSQALVESLGHHAEAFKDCGQYLDSDGSVFLGSSADVAQRLMESLPAELEELDSTIFAVMYLSGRPLPLSGGTLGEALDETEKKIQAIKHVATFDTGDTAKRALALLSQMAIEFLRISTALERWRELRYGAIKQSY